MPWRGRREDRPCDATFPTPPAVPDDSRHAGQGLVVKSGEPSVRSAPVKVGGQKGPTALPTGLKIRMP